MSKQLDVFEAPLSGISLVEASAGTGKTYNITSLYVRAILEKGLEPSQVLVMTYTEAATAELKSRLRTRLKDSLRAIQENDGKDDEFLQKLIDQNYEQAEKKLKTAIDHFDEASVFTIHGFCSRLLSEYSLQFGVSPNFELLTDHSELLQDCVDDYWRTFIRSADSDTNSSILLNFLTDAGFGPDELQSVVNEILNHPNSKVIPDNYNLKKLYKEISQLEEKLQELKNIWSEEGEALFELYHSGNLNGRYFREGAKKDQDWKNLKDLISSKKAKIAVSDRMSRFGSYMREKGGSKKFTVPEFNIFNIIDEYIAIADHLRLLKPVFIKESIDSIKERFNEQKEISNLLTYNDLLESVESGLRNDSSGQLAARLSNKYPLALVDEFQDTDPIQYSIFRQIYFGRESVAVFMIGDPKQAIYGFRGADIFTYLEAKRDADKSQSYSLSDNYRSNSLMIKGINELFLQSDTPFLINGLSFKPANFPTHKNDGPYLKRSNGEIVNSLQAITLNKEEYTSKTLLEEEIYSSVCDEILELVSGEYRFDDRNVEEKDIAILIRKGFQGEKIQEMLRRRGLKSVLKSRTSVFTTRESEDLFLVLKSLQSLSNEQGIRASLATELLGYSATDIQELLNNEKLWSATIQKFVLLKELWENQGIEPVIQKLIHLFDVQERFSVYTDAERRITNLMHLSELLGKAQVEQQVHGKALLKWFFQKKQDTNTDTDAEQLRLESDEDLIQISTIHSSKGLQYPIVICPFLWDSGADIKKTDILKFHEDGKNYIDISQGVSHSNREEYERLVEEQEMAEEVRLAYVALTRSVAANYIIVPNYNKVDQSPLATILKNKNDTNPSDFNSIESTLSKCKHIEVRPPVKTCSGKKDNKPKEPIVLQSAQLTRKDIFQYPRMLSYSSLSEGGKHDDSGHDYDELLSFEQASTLTIDRYGFPRGANAGTCLHKIFEDISFESPVNLEQVVADNLDYYGFDDIWRTPVVKWVNNILDVNLGKPEVSLSSVKDEDVLKEMEFFFPVDNLRSDDLWNMIRGEKPLAEDLDYVSGYLKGFIDLIFRCEDRYFILDYKSNHLGDSPSDYSNENLKQAMLDAGYDLQYHIYTLALHRFLQKRISGYSYENNFGGIIYLFLRGVEKEKPGSGVFFDKPAMELIHHMDDYFKQEER